MTKRPTGTKEGAGSEEHDPIKGDYSAQTEPAPTEGQSLTEGSGSEEHDPPVKTDEYSVQGE